RSERELGRPFIVLSARHRSLLHPPAHSPGTRCSAGRPLLQTILVRDVLSIAAGADATRRTPRSAGPAGRPDKSARARTPRARGCARLYTGSASFEQVKRAGGTMAGSDQSEIGRAHV